MSHSASAEADSIDRGAQVCRPSHSDEERISLALSHQRVAVKRRACRRWSRPSAGGAGRAQARALTGVGWSGSAVPAIMACCLVMRSAGPLDCGSGGTHCASKKRRVNAVRRLSTVVESERTLPEPRKTRLHLVLTQCADIDSRADRTSKPCLLLSCYQAVGGLRLAGPALSCAKPPSDKNQDKQDASRFGVDLAQLISRVFVDRRCSSCLLVDRGQNAGAAAVAPVVCNSGAGRCQADRSQSDVIMSDIVDSGR
jgi:hypothetical protein